MRSISLKKTLIALITLSIFLTGGVPKAHAQSDRIVFGVIGDYGLAGQPLLDVSNLIKSWNPDFIVTTGDNNYPDGAAWSMDQNVGQYFHEYLFRYKGKYGSGSPTQRFFHWISLACIITMISYRDPFTFSTLTVIATSRMASRQTQCRHAG